MGNCSRLVLLSSGSVFLKKRVDRNDLPPLFVPSHYIFRSFCSFILFYPLTDEQASDEKGPKRIHTQLTTWSHTSVGCERKRWCQGPALGHETRKGSIDRPPESRLCRLQQKVVGGLVWVSKLLDRTAPVRGTNAMPANACCSN